FSLKEVDLCQQEGLVFTTLGKRILRCETAPIAALAAISAILEE
ncbi:MAG: 16S rRNA (uracil(1498)-N(3))-methyltransferase, partial [Clostridia bacterium]|nr:16S rRNA (uracil(1498)-N(3))-methyltransferase [Clostridia bacterium]